MTLAEEIKKNFKSPKFKWHDRLANYLKEKFSEGDRHIKVYGSYGPSWTKDDNNMDSFNIKSVIDWLKENGFVIEKCDQYGYTNCEFTISITLPYN